MLDVQLILVWYYLSKRFVITSWRGTRRPLISVLSTFKAIPHLTLELKSIKLSTPCVTLTLVQQDIQHYYHFYHNQDFSKANDKKLKREIRRLENHGKTDARYHFFPPHHGWNSRSNPKNFFFFTTFLRGTKKLLEIFW